MKTIITTITAILLLSSCTKEEIVKPVEKKTSTETMQIFTDTTYNHSEGYGQNDNSEIIYSVKDTFMNQPIWSVNYLADAVNINENDEFELLITLNVTKRSVLYIDFRTRVKVGHPTSTELIGIGSSSLVNYRNMINSTTSKTVSYYVKFIKWKKWQDIYDTYPYLRGIPVYHPKYYIIFSESKEIYIKSLILRKVK